MAKKPKMSDVLDSIEELELMLVTLQEANKKTGASTDEAINYLAASARVTKLAQSVSVQYLIALQLEAGLSN